MQENIVQLALEKLKAVTDIHGTFTAIKENNTDGVLELLIDNKKEILTVLVRKELRNHQLNAIYEIAKLYNNKLIVIAENIFPRIKQELKQLGVAYLDIAGNTFLKTKDNFVYIEGLKAEKTGKEKTGRAFKTAGLKLIYHILTDNDLINKPQRTIAETTDIAVGNVNYILKELKDMNFLLRKNKKEYKIVNQKELFLKWINEFNDNLKTKLHIGNFRFLDNDNYINWKNIELKIDLTLWGGEPAAAILTKHLLPEIYTIYTDEKRENLIKNYRLIPDPNGDVQLYQKFWNTINDNKESTAPPLLVYADLINTSNRRNVETANMIYDEYLQNKF
jgi:hypothetical protein